jgi:hypothetical protein
MARSLLSLLCVTAALAGCRVVVADKGKAWDGDYDWRGHPRRHPGAVPEMIIEISARRR